MTGLILWTLLGCQPSKAPLPAAPTAAVEPAELVRVWTYAADPKEEVGTEPLYTKSTMTFTAEGQYLFKLGRTPKPLSGTYNVVQWGPDGGELHTDYGEGRTNQLHLSARRGQDGQLIGFVVREGPEKVGGRYYTAQD